MDIHSELILKIKELHRQKDAAYGPSWKRRGELISILANIARKVDRIEQFSVKKVNLPGESVFDTAVDLFVYVTKYRLFLFEKLPSPCAHLPPFAQKPFSDFPENFDFLINSIEVTSIYETEPNVIREILISFEKLQELAEQDSSSLEQKLSLAERLSCSAFNYVRLLLVKDPSLTDGLIKL